MNSETDLSSDDESVIETIEQHKKLVNGKLSYKIKCSSGNKQWALEDLLKKDVPEMVKEYNARDITLVSQFAFQLSKEPWKPGFHHIDTDDLTWGCSNWQ